MEEHEKKKRQEEMEKDKITYFLNLIDERSKEYPKEYKETLLEMFGEVVSFEELNKKYSDSAQEIARKFYAKIGLSVSKKKLEESTIDVGKLTRSIQESRSGRNVYHALTDFNCAFCGKTETWRDSGVPQICKECAEEMATNIALHYSDILKDTKGE